MKPRWAPPRTHSVALNVTEYLDFTRRSVSISFLFLYPFLLVSDFVAKADVINCGSGLLTVLGGYMVEHPLSEYKCVHQPPEIDLQGVRSPLIDCSINELYLSYARYRFLFELNQKISSSIKIQDLVHIVLDYITELISVQRCLLHIFNLNGQIVFAGLHNFKKEDLLVSEYQIINKIITKVMTENTLLCLENIYRNEELVDPSGHQNQSLSVICMPILFQQHCIGVLYVDDPKNDGNFFTHCCPFLENIAKSISGYLFSVLKQIELETKIVDLQSHLVARKRYHSILGTSHQVQELLDFIDQVADTPATVLIEGESGTGKELVAQALHENSKRRHNAFVPLNCGALSESLLESELFGHVRGAFTGAIKDKKGWFEVADGGTIFFDEISEMSPALQVKLLRILQTGEFSPVGSNEIKKCDVRVIVASNKNLEQLVQANRFRPDLYYRLNILYFYLPPLRERREDIPLLAEYYLNYFAKQYNKKELTLSSQVFEVFKNYDFPGNIRELENAIQHAVVVAVGNRIELNHLPRTFQVSRGTGVDKPFADAKQQTLASFEKNYIEKVLKQSRGVIAKAARIAGMDTKNLYEKMTRYGISAATFKA